MSIRPSDLTVPEPGWRSDPARLCIGKTGLFFPKRSDARRLAAATDAICAACPVLSSCRSYALLEGDGLYGRLAGTGPADRSSYRRRWGVRPPSMPSIEAVMDPIIDAIKLRQQQIASPGPRLELRPGR